MPEGRCDGGERQEILMARVIERRMYERRDKGQSLRSPCSFQKPINIKSFSLTPHFFREINPLTALSCKSPDYSP